MPTPFARRLSRRRFLGASGAGAAALLVGCAAPPSEQTSDGEQERNYVPGAAADGPLPTLEEMVGGIMLLGFRGLELTPGNPIVADIRDRNLGGVILFSYDVPSDTPVRNIESPEQVAALCAALHEEAAGRKLLIAADQEGGLVARLGPNHGFPPAPSAQALGELGDLEQTRQAGAAAGETLRAAGINWNLAPVVDVNVNPDNPVIGGIERSFSADPAEVTAQAGAFIDGCRSAGVLTAVKHFPGHGSSRDDSHEGFVDVTDTWSGIELQPYRDLAAAGKVDSVLTAHVFNANLDPSYPASLSAATIQGILRDEIGYTGVVVTDDMMMGAITQQWAFAEAIRLALMAGNDILLYGNNLGTFEPELGARVHSTVLDLVRSGDIPEARIAEAYARVQALKALLA